MLVFASLPESVFACYILKVRRDLLEQVISEVETNIQLGAIKRIRGSVHFHFRLLCYDHTFGYLSMHP